MIEKMRPSGIEWIKDIPQTWKINKIKFLATEANSIFIDGDWIESDVIEESGIRYLTTGNVGVGVYKEQGTGYISKETFKKLNCLEVLPGDLMISRLNEPIGRACIVPDTETQYVVAVDNVIIRPNLNYCSKYLMYIMNTDGYAENGNIIARGSTMSRISKTQLGQFWVVVPPYEEQKSIANFLDKECSKINAIIQNIEKEIEVLQKYRKSLITEIVTKGLDKNISMKNSGIKWIGEIPEHWKIKRLKYICTLKTGTTPEGNEGINFDGEGKKWFTPSDFTPNLSLENAEKHISEDIIKRERIKLYPKDSVLLVGIGATVGKTGILSEESYSNQQITAIMPKDIVGSYLLYYLASKSEYIRDNALYTTLPIINNAYLSNISVILPTLNEQNEISKYLNKKCQEIDNLISDKLISLEMLQQYKKSLIYECVTGKKRVMGVQENGN